MRGFTKKPHLKTIIKAKKLILLLLIIFFLLIFTTFTLPFIELKHLILQIVNFWAANHHRV